MDILVSYAGRFQPFHINHYNVYKHLTEKFGNGVYISTSDKTNTTDSPFNFNEKKDIILTLFGINKNKIIKIKSPYNLEEFVGNFKNVDLNKTAVIVVVGEKDLQRSVTKYYKTIPKNGELLSYNENDKQPYMYIAPLETLKYDNELISGTLVRKLLSKKEESKDFFKFLFGKYNDDIYNKYFKRLLKESKNNIMKKFIKEGGAAGHLNHPFDDLNLTFKDLYTFIKLGLSGKLTVNNVQEKLDGINIQVTFKNNKVYLARNAGHVKNYGETALTIDDIDTFIPYETVAEGLKLALKDLQTSFKKLDADLLEKTFKKGLCYINLEVIYSKLPVTIPYSKNFLVMHGMQEYDITGKKVSYDTNQTKELAAILKNTNTNVQKSFEIKDNKYLEVLKNKDYSSKILYYNTKLQKLQSKFNLKNTDKIVKYHENYWKEYILHEAEKLSLTINQKLLDSLLQRFVQDDTSVKLIDLKAMAGDDKELKAFVDRLDKVDKKKLYAEILMPFQILFLEVGVDVLKNVKQFVDNSEMTDRTKKLKTMLVKAIDDIKDKKDINKINKMITNLEKLNEIGGEESILGTEGIVFTYNNKLYKLTGAFAPIHQIIGMLKFDR